MDRIIRKLMTAYSSSKKAKWMPDYGDKISHCMRGSRLAGD